MTYQEQALRRRNKGFTTLELLVVIGLILFLIGLMFLGLKHVTGQARVSHTKTLLETAQTMMTNYENATHFQKTPVIGIYPPDSTFWTEQDLLAPGSGYQPSGSGPWTFKPDPRNNFSPDGAGLLDGMAPIPPGVIASAVLPQTTALVRTVIAMQMFMTVPENVTILNNLPPADKKVFMYDTSIGKLYPIPPATPPPPAPPVGVVSVTLLLDSWGSPILFAPSGGLGNIILSADPVTSVLPSLRAQFSTHITSPAIPSATPVPPVPSDRAFFFSVGPDGDASQADDNIYPFQN